MTVFLTPTWGQAMLQTPSWRPCSCAWWCMVPPEQLQTAMSSPPPGPPTNTPPAGPPTNNAFPPPGPPTNTPTPSPPRGPDALLLGLAHSKSGPGGVPHVPWHMASGFLAVLTDLRKAMTAVTPEFMKVPRLGVCLQFTVRSLSSRSQSSSDCCTDVVISILSGDVPVECSLIMSALMCRSPSGRNGGCRGHSCSFSLGRS